jgi:hypothetical protein
LREKKGGVSFVWWSRHFDFYFYTKKKNKYKTTTPNRNKKIISDTFSLFPVSFGPKNTNEKLDRFTLVEKKKNKREILEGFI